jgi:transcriptional regulator with GAF, ATPase, and Fis domain
VDPSKDVRFGQLVGRSQAMRDIFGILEKVAATDLTVTVQGETGTGKDLVARAIHDGSPRSDGPFVVFDAGAVASNLIESELFGHEKGAFTGATEQRQGAFERADGGTLFIDEIGEGGLCHEPLFGG